MGEGGGGDEEMGERGSVGGLDHRVESQYVVCWKSIDWEVRIIEGRC